MSVIARLRQQRPKSCNASVRTEAIEAIVVVLIASDALILISNAWALHCWRGGKASTCSGSELSCGAGEFNVRLASTGNLRRPACGSAARRARAPGTPHRADRVGELRKPARARGAGLGAHEQI